MNPQNCDQSALNITPKYPNLYGAILIFRGFFWSDPHPTPVFCRNMAKICELHIPHKFSSFRNL